MNSPPPREDAPRRESAWRRFARADIVPRVLVILVGVPLVVGATLLVTP